ncbi:hypothetical protein K490DRAFT_59636 [Saccharata proteae CBS 121410]|uniref:Uncharacterized protein n=1 Tax=Saccharata proteae CBS 121410 TaxID=1314787 RepID=A0A9P4HQZ1_9PEZI|nr:hypothetical protein K490DRAFT_59636 [Saccharata proteae CBS 121410]
MPRGAYDTSGLRKEKEQEQPPGPSHPPPQSPAAGSIPTVLTRKPNTSEFETMGSEKACWFQLDPVALVAMSLVCSFLYLGFQRNSQWNMNDFDLPQNVDCSFSLDTEVVSMRSDDLKSYRVDSKQAKKIIFAVISLLPSNTKAECVGAVRVKVRSCGQQHSPPSTYHHQDLVISPTINNSAIFITPQQHDQVRFYFFVLMSMPLSK